VQEGLNPTINIEHASMDAISIMQSKTTINASNDGNEFYQQHS